MPTHFNNRYKTIRKLTMTDTLDNTLTDPATGLAYRLRAAADTQGKAPCLILLHGVGSNESGFIDLARRIDPDLVVILARGPLVLGPQQFAWFQVSFTASGPAIDAQQAEAARVTLSNFIAQLPQRHDIDPARIWIAGFSQGGIMSAGVALTQPGQVAGFGILSGRILPEVLPLVQAGPQLAALQGHVSHGVQDQVLGIHFARKSREVLGELGVPLSYHEYEEGHRLSGAMAGDFLQWLSLQLCKTTMQRTSFY